jgi:hypothetical protein
VNASAERVDKSRRDVFGGLVMNAHRSRRRFLGLVGVGAAGGMLLGGAASGAEEPKKGTRVALDRLIARDGRERPGGLLKHYRRQAA